MHKAVTYYPSFFLFLFSYFSIFYCKILFNPYKYYSYLPKELLWTKELLCSLVCYLFVRNVYAFFTLKKTLKRPFKAILKSFKLLLIFYRIHFTFSFFALHTLQSRMRKSYPHFHKPFKFAILRGCSSLFTYTVFLILLFLLHLYHCPDSRYCYCRPLTVKLHHRCTPLWHLLKSSKERLHSDTFSF